MDMKGITHAVRNYGEPASEINKLKAEVERLDGENTHEIKVAQEACRKLAIGQQTIDLLRIELEKLVVRVEELETVLSKVQQWGADARSADSYEVFQAVRLSLINLAPSRETIVVDCTCVPCTCPTIGDERCLGCGARTCMAHELAKTSSRPSPEAKSREGHE